MRDSTKAKIIYSVAATLIAFAFVLRSVFYLTSAAFEFYPLWGTGEYQMRNYDKAFEESKRASDRFFDEYQKALNSKASADVLASVRATYEAVMERKSKTATDILDIALKAQQNELKQDVSFI